MTNQLQNQHCVPCEGGIDPLTREAAEGLMPQVPLWILDEDGTSIKREVKLETFMAAIDFVNEVAQLAESEGHHPDISISYNKVHLILTTHAIKGLSYNDFILALKIDKILLK